MTTKPWLLLIPVLLALGDRSPAADLSGRDNLTLYLSNFVHEISKPRHLFGEEDHLRWTADRIFGEFQKAGLQPKRLPFHVPQKSFPQLQHDQSVDNIEAVISGYTKEVIVIGAHYDTFPPLPHWDAEDWSSNGAPEKYRGTPGADDNASGVATMLALAHRLQAEAGTSRFSRTIRFVAFANEEPPFFRTSYMGSRQYAQQCAENGDRIVLMFTPETLGFYASRPDRKAGVGWCERFVFGLRMGFGARYVAFLSDDTSIRSARKARALFRKHSDVPVRAGSFSSSVRRVPFLGLQSGYEERARERSRSDPVAFPSVRWSDDASFWQYGFHAFAVTDSAHLRNRRYHECDDVPGSLDYETLNGVRHPNLLGSIEFLQASHSERFREAVS